MIDRMSVGLMPDKPHTALRDENGHLFYEEMFTRGGFSGAFTYLYHRFAPTPALEVTPSRRGHPVPKLHEPGLHPLKRRLYDTRRMKASGTVFDGRVPILFNKDVAIYFAVPAASDDAYFANGDGDELWYVQEGALRLESSCGWLPVREGDYVWIPKSMIHRWHLVSGSARMMCFEGTQGVMIPNDFRNPVGQLKMDAPYTHRDFVRPEGPIATPDAIPEGPHELYVKKGGAFTKLVLERTPMDVVGWDGFAYPWAFNIEKYQPKTGLVHLPPTIHTTFAGPGFLVCSFVPRVTDTHPQAIPCPYPHSSVDCDEVILYVRGNFTSRRGVGPGALSLHPAGVVHGPHPGAYEASIGTVRTDEMAVMLDTYLPLLPTLSSQSLEDAGYHDTWRSAK
ncbi:MAG: homogentisate 1,2-dioxygenase [Labilithrix sp.]|nr:homogentisate 1,2-dioxygenase [Labilithrix sp.]MCW5815119.1 homogentisate 1,2-dioxygenase [Labilithrix sp.]